VTLRFSLILAMVIVSVGFVRADPLPPLGGMLANPPLWAAYKAAFISPGGRVIDNANGNISHSEGQGYAMLLAVAADDRATFDSLWDWTRQQLMLRDDGLAVWRWNPDASPHVSDRNNATDGDLLIAWALAEAGERWSDPAFKTASVVIVRALMKAVVTDSRFGPLLLPGAAGFGAKDRPDGPVVNPSYWVYPALARLAALQPDESWTVLSHSGANLLSASRFGPLRLPSDWVAIGGEAAAPAKGFRPVFGYDAIRVPLYLAWGMPKKSLMAPFAALWPDATAPTEVTDLASGEAVEPLSDSGYRAVVALLRCALDGARLGPEVRSATVDRYYPTTLRMLVLVAARQRYPQCL
jgi:endoglucanase